MRFGKLNSGELKELLSIFEKRRREVVASGELGEDCAVLELGKLQHSSKGNSLQIENESSCQKKYLLTTDPITSATANAGYYAMHISANDIFAGGGVPMFAMLTIIAPTNSSFGEIKDVAKDAECVAKKLNIEIVGGHTEFSGAVGRIVVSVTMLGEAVIKTRKIEAGDTLIVTKSIGLEGAKILSEAKKEKLAGVLGNEDWNAIQNIDVSIESEAGVVREFFLKKDERVALHDVTEGGVFGAIAELCEGRGLYAEVCGDDIPLQSFVGKLCEYFGVNPYALLSSGCLLIATRSAEGLLQEFQKRNIKASVIGKIEAGDKESFAVFGNKILTMTVSGDEIGKIL